MLLQLQVVNDEPAFTLGSRFLSADKLTDNVHTLIWTLNLCMIVCIFICCTALTLNRTSQTWNRTTLTWKRTALTWNHTALTWNHTALTWNRTALNCNRTALTLNRTALTLNRTALTMSRTALIWNRTALNWNRMALTWNRMALTLGEGDNFFWNFKVNFYFFRFKNLQGLSMCFKLFTAKYVVGGAESAPPGWNRVKGI